MDFDSIPEKGFVFIRAGASVRSYNPSKRNYVTKRNQKVRVRFKFKNGYENERTGEIVPPEISWAGTGGYWCHTNIENVIGICD